MAQPGRRFYFRLALAMGMSVRQLLHQFDSAELGEWAAYYRLEPWGELTADLRHGIAVAALANINRDQKKKPEPYTPKDFIPWHESHRQEQEQRDGLLLADPEAQSAAIKRLFRNAGSVP